MTTSVSVNNTSDAIHDAMQRIEEGRFDDALALVEQALALESDDPDLWNCKGVALRGMGRYEESSRCFDKSLRIDPRDRHSS